MSEKFNEFEKDHKEKEEIINSLKQEVNGLKERVESLEKASDDHEQYSRRNCLLIHGIDEGKDKALDDVVVNMLEDKLKFEILKKHIDRSHRIGKISLRKKRAVIVKFVWYNDRQREILEFGIWRRLAHYFSKKTYKLLKIYLKYNLKNRRRA